MKHFCCAVIMSLLALRAAAQTKIDTRLKYELDSIYEVDQRYRILLFVPGGNRNPDSLAATVKVPKAQLFNYLYKKLQLSDSANLQRVQAIIKQRGYPGKSLVGTPTDEAAWHVIQHAPAAISRYIPLMKSAAEKGELPYYRYAMMLDRQLVGEGKEQIYGTQGQSYNSQPPFIWPIQNPRQVNRRRKLAGFKTTVEENAAEMRIPYQILTLRDVAGMKK